MQFRFLLIQFALGFTAIAQIGPPSLGVTGGTGRQVMEIQGVPEAWVARPVLDGPADAAASSSAQLCWTSQGILYIRNKPAGKVTSYPVPEGDARFAFDAKGQLAAAWFLKTGEVYTRAAGWRAVYTSPGPAAPLDLTVGNSGALMLLYRSESGLYRTRMDAVTGAVLSETKLDDLSGPALLDASGNPIFAAAAGIAAVDSARRVDRNWMLLTTSHGLWLWQPGKQAQGVPVASGATPALQLWPPNSYQDVGAAAAMPTTPVGSSTQIEYVLSNQGANDVYLSSLHLTTASPFRLSGAVSTPWRIAAGTLVGFFINFTPTSVGAVPPSSLTIDYCNAGDFDSTSNSCPAAATFERNITISGDGIAAPASGPWLTGISPESNMTGAPAFTVFLNGGGFIAGSTVQWNGTPLTTTFVSSAQLSATVPANLLTAPADAHITVSNPPGGTANVTKPWTFHVYSTLTPSIALSDQNDAPLTASQLTSNMTVRVRIKLDQATTASPSGVLELGFQPASASVASDPSVALGSPGSDSQVGSVQMFTVPTGATTALFGNKDYVTLTTGTTAGGITLAVSLQYALPATPEHYVINPAPPVLLKSSKVFTAGSTVLKFEGYDNTRSISGISFTFYTASGAVVSPGTFIVDVTKDYSNYFQANAQIGGSFALTATFPVTGDISKIASVKTTFTNSAGTTTNTQ